MSPNEDVACAEIDESFSTQVGTVEFTLTFQYDYRALLSECPRVWPRWGDIGPSRMALNRNGHQMKVGVSMD